MTIKKLTHAELADAQARSDWPLLWQHAAPLVKLVIGRMRKDGAAQSDNRDADGELLQQGMLIAGEAMREWKPLECTFSTHICNRVRWDLLHSAQDRANGGIGSYKQKPTVLSLGDERPDAEPDMATGEDGGDESGEGGTFEEALTYAGVVMANGQYDGDGYVPQGFGDPSESIDLGAKAAISAALQHLTAEELELVSTIHGLGGGQTQTLVEYAEARGIPYATARRRLASAKAILSQHLRKFSN